MGTQRRRKEQPSPLDGRKARVCVERAGLSIVVEDVNAPEAGVVAADLLKAFRALGQHFPELREFPDTVIGGTPIYVPDEYEDADGSGGARRPIGF